MNALITVNMAAMGENLVQSVNARELHGFLESRQDFSTWIKARIEQYSFVEGQDYLLHKIVDNPLGGRPTLEYHVSIDAAKELAMVERSAKGKEARQYFIECERRAKAIDPMMVLNDPAKMRTLLLGFTEKVIELEAVVANQAPKVQAFDRIALSDGSLCITDAAKTLQIQPRTLTQLLQEHHWTYRRPMGSGWLAYQDRIQSGLMEHKITTGEKSDGHEWTSTQARITPKGLTKLAEVVRQAGMH